MSDKVLETSQTAFTDFQANLPTAEPFLFNLADQLVAHAPEASWDVMICDDIAGRLPTYFLRRVLSEAGHTIPTRYVAGSKYQQVEFGERAYEDYFRGIASGLGKSSLNVLLTTEITDGGASIDFLEDRLQPVAARVDRASVVNRRPDYMTTTFYGGLGQEAGDAITRTFESAPTNTWKSKIMEPILYRIPLAVSRRIPHSLKRATGPQNHPLIGMKVLKGVSVPIASRNGAAPHRKLAYAEMESLVAKYCAERSIGSGEDADAV